MTAMPAFDASTCADAAEESVAGGARRERGAARSDRRVLRGRDDAPRLLRRFRPAAPGCRTRRCRACAGCRPRACARSGMTPAAFAARSMCSVVSSDAGPCSLSMTTKSKPACPHISTSAGAGSADEHAEQRPRSAQSAGRRVSSGAQRRACITTIRSITAAIPCPPPMHIVIEAVAAAGALQLVDALDREDAAGRADRVTERDGAAVRIHLLRVEPELLRDAHRLRRERLVRLDDVEVADLELRLRERALDGGDRAEAHDLRIDAGVAVRHQARHRLQALALRGRALHQHDRGCGIVDARRVARGDRAVLLLEHGLELRHAFERRVGADVLVGVDDDRALLALESRSAGSAP